MSIGSLFKRIGGFFTSGKAERALQRALGEVEKLMPLVLPIVEQIGKASGNRTVIEVVALFETHGVKWIKAYEEDPDYALQKLARELINRAVPEGVGKSIANLAIETAVNGLKK